MAKFLVQHWRAPNDTSGNPRRLFVLFRTRRDALGDAGTIARVIDEGFRGEPSFVRTLPHLPAMAITATEYRDMLKTYKEG